MVRETAETFGIATRDDKFRGSHNVDLNAFPQYRNFLIFSIRVLKLQMQLVPKKGSVFIFQVDCWKITLLGDKLTSRNLRL
ncbi:hypothetical protein Patl1_32046 [Pistacia atlantica]|uniref:Uncharacterized protein n=1 Tax=Pistacia atlantica TaxID=434234 RepID=A0ACC1AP80_9ROSI|nr:hypothetical protein Patl1_32046 [Pistacia atlantica]